MHHVIYLPRQRATDPQALEQVGLGDHAPNATFTALPVDQPVTGELTGGVLVTWSATAPRLNDLPALHWLPAMPIDGLPAGRYLVGLDARRPPAPHELLKGQLYDGAPVALGDGHLWVVPYAQALPFDLVRNAQTGALQHEVRPAFYAFWATALGLQRVFDAHSAGQPLPSQEEQVAFLEEALRLNYRLTPEVISWLRLFQSGRLGTLQACLQACLHVTPEGTD